MPHMAVPPVSSSSAAGRRVSRWDSRYPSEEFAGLPVRSSREVSLNERDQALGDLVGLVLSRRLDHHPHQRLGAAWPQEDAATARQRGGLLRGRLVNGGSCLKLAAVAHAHVDEPLWQLFHGVAVSEIRAGKGLEGEQRGGDAVPAGDEVPVDDVARLLAAERPVAVAQSL